MTWRIVPVTTSCSIRRSRLFVKTTGTQIRVVHGAPKKPTKKQIALSLLHGLAFRADAAEDLEQHAEGIALPLGSYPQSAIYPRDAPTDRQALSS